MTPAPTSSTTSSASTTPASSGGLTPVTGGAVPYLNRPRKRGRTPGESSGAGVRQPSGRPSPTYPTIVPSRDAPPRPLPIQNSEEPKDCAHNDRSGRGFLVQTGCLGSRLPNKALVSTLRRNSFAGVASRCVAGANCLGDSGTALPPGEWPETSVRPQPHCL